MVRGRSRNRGSHLSHGHICCRVGNWLKWLTNLRTAAAETNPRERPVGRDEMRDDDEEEEGLGGAMAEALETEIQHTEDDRVLSGGEGTHREEASA